MADIFGGVQPPAWLQRDSKPWEGGDFGESLGYGLATGFKNPKVALQAQLMSTQLLEEKADLATKSLVLAQKQKDDAAWLTHDQGILHQWIEDRKTNPDAPLPGALESERGWKTYDAAEKVFTQQDNSKRAAEQRKRFVEQDNAYNATDNTTKDVIAGISKRKNDPNIDAQGWHLDPRSGQRLYLDPDAEQAINDWRTKNNLLPVGVTKAQVRPETTAEKQAIIQSDKIEMEKLRQEDREKLEKIRQQSTYSGKPEVYTAPDGQQFLIWGKEIRDLNKLPPQTKAEVDYWTSHLKKLDTERIKNADKTLDTEIQQTKERIRKLLTQAAPAPAPAPAPAAPPAKPVKKYNPATDSFE